MTDIVITPDDAISINKYLKTLCTEDERVFLIGEIAEGICHLCGDIITHRCHCDNDT